MRGTDLLYEYYEPDSDKLFKREMSDTRRPKLTLKHINKLRKIRDLEKAEHSARLEFIKTMYGSSGTAE